MIHPAHVTKISDGLLDWLLAFVVIPALDWAIRAKGGAR